MPDYELDIDLGRQAPSESTKTPFESFYLHRVGLTSVEREYDTYLLSHSIYFRFGSTGVEREYENTV